MHGFATALQPLAEKIYQKTSTRVDLPPIELDTSAGTKPAQASMKTKPKNASAAALGKRRMAKLTKKQRSALGKKAAAARWSKKQ